MFEQQILRQLRRLSFTAVISAFGALMIFGPTISAVTIALLIAAMSVVVVLYFPRFRTACESLALGMVVTACLPLPIDVLPTTLAGSSFLMNTLMYGRWTDNIGPGLRLRIDRRAKVSAPPARIWGAIVPGEAHPDDFWNSRLVDFNHDPDDVDTVYLRMRRETGLCEEMTLTFLERDMGVSCRYILEREEPNGRDDMVRSLTIKPTGPRECEVHSVMEQNNLPYRIALLRWFDNRFGDELTSLAQTVQTTGSWQIQSEV